MNTELLTSTKNAITRAVSGQTKHVYFDHLPDAALLKKLTVVFELSNTDNLNTFDFKELGKTYQLRIKINAPLVENLSNVSIYIKDQIYKLPLTNHIRLIEDDDTFFDSELEVWTENITFEIQISK